MSASEEYYRVGREDNDSYPLLEWAENALPYMRAKPVRDPHVIALAIGEPVPDELNMVDYHPLPKPVFHDRFKPLFDGLIDTKVQTIPAEIRLPDGRLRDDYFFPACIQQDQMCRHDSLKVW